MCAYVPVNPPSAMLNMNLLLAFFFSSLAAPAAAAPAEAPLSLLLSPFCSLVASSGFGASFSSFRSAAEA